MLYLIIYINFSYGNDIKLLRLTSFARQDSKPVQLTRAFSTFNQSNIKLNPLFVTGFTDAEGSFMVNIVKSSKYKVGWMVQASFSIGLHKKDSVILEQIKATLGNIGNISQQGSDAIRFRVQSIKDLFFVIDHFDKFPLITQKRGDYILWKSIVEIMQEKEHLTQEGLEKIVAIKASLNKGLSDDLKTAFPNITPIPKPVLNLESIKHPNWLAGFVSGEGCFLISIYKAKTNSGEAVKLIFQITQHNKDELLLGSMLNFFGEHECGKIIKDRDTYHYRVTKFIDIYEKVIPFFWKYPILGVKSKNFQDFSLVADLMKENKHLTPGGLEQIRRIKANMNKGRID